MRRHAALVLNGPVLLLMACSVAASCLAGAPAGTPLPRAGVFVFSTLCDGGGDPGGAEIVLIRGAAGNTAVFTHTSEGPISAPLLAYGPDVKIDDRTGHITLRFVDAELGRSGIYQFEGSVSGELLDVVSAGYIGSLHLPRITKFDPKLPACRPAGN